MAKRYTGRLKKWNPDRAFGFIVPADGGPELFVHVTAFARKGPSPTVGDELSFEVEPDRNGKKRAVRALRPGEQPAYPCAQPPTGAAAAAPRIHTLSRAPKGSGSGVLGKWVTVALVCALLWFGYSAYAKRAAEFGSRLPAPPTVTLPMPATLLSPEPALSLPGKRPLPAGFSCDGRSMCSQMTSCQEATLFLQNCPGMKMDGNGDGVPCEQQWCTK